MIEAASPVAKQSIARVSNPVSVNNGGQTTGSNGQAGGSTAAEDNPLIKLGRATISNALDLVDPKGEIAAKGKALLKTATDALKYGVPGTQVAGTTPTSTTPTQQPQVPFGSPAGGGPSGGGSGGSGGSRGGGSGGGSGGGGGSTFRPNNGGGNTINPNGGTTTEQNLNPKTNQAAAGLDSVMQGVNDKPLLVKFGASWCGGCNTFDTNNGITSGGEKTNIPGATLHDKGTYSILKVDTDTNTSLAGQIGVDTSTIPALGYAYRKQDGSIGIAQSLSEAQTEHTKTGDVKIPEPTKSTEESSKTTPKPTTINPLTKVQKDAFIDKPTFSDKPGEGISRTDALQYLKTMSDKASLTSQEKDFIKDFTEKKISDCNGTTCTTSRLGTSKYSENLKTFNEKYDGKFGYHLNGDKTITSHTGEPGEITFRTYPDPNKNLDANLAEITQKVMKEEASKPAEEKKPE